MVVSAQSDPSSQAKITGPAEAPLFLEHYQILGIIGQGGMGTVFKAFHVNLKRHVAIKTLRIDKITTADAVGRFRQEMELVGQMDHPNVVRASDAGERNGIFYLVMEFLSGCDLGTLVTRRGPLDLPNACELIRQAAMGLDYIHRTFVHRDIKPTNLMLTTGGLVKVLDLGLAHCELATLSDREETPFGYAVGTFSYMAPEQAGGGRHIDARADIYSLGCTLFKLLTGRTPYSGPAYDNAAKQLNAHCNIPLTSVAGFDTLPEKIKPVLARMTAKDPDQRYPTAREVAQALAPLAGNSRTAGLLDGADEPPVAPVPTPPPQEWTRLTQSLVDTPRDSARDSTYTAAPPVPVPTRRLRWTAMVAAALVGLGLVIWAVATIANRYAGPPDLDQAPLNEPVYLLAHEPTPIGCDRGDNSRYVWSKTEQRLMFPAGRTTLFQMGMTTRTNFTFEVDLKQATPWPCKFGIYWGYREDATLNDRAVPNQKFAWFHYLEFAHRANEGKHSFWVHRGHGTLRYNKDGQIVGPGGIKAESEDVGLLAERRNVLIEIRNNRLVRARVGNVELKDVVTAINDPDVLQQTSQGGFGVFSTGEGATVTHARFILHSRQ